jgi:ABC-type nitrate/sulfonate/bicarbonate transport system substrate-binding protein
MSRIAKSALGFAVVASLAAFALQPAALMRWLGCCGPTETIRLGAYEGDVGALGWIAQEQGFYEKVGLVAEIKGYPSGKEAADALRAGTVDVAMASIRRCLAQLHRATCAYWQRTYYRTKGVGGRRDPAFRTTDLKGKRIGVTSPSGANIPERVPGPVRPDRAGRQTGQALAATDRQRNRQRRQ